MRMRTQQKFCARKCVERTEIGAIGIKLISKRNNLTDLTVISIFFAEKSNNWKVVNNQAHTGAAQAATAEGKRFS